ncbi:MAG: hypothetical protein HRU19_11880 [Pseudobacteriovorax sp.]|nr:hypothetical protein [Pseudobacteriovorax sp.]
MSGIRITIWLVSLLFVWGAFKSPSNASQYFRLKDRLEVLEATVSSIEGDIAGIEDELHKIKSNPRYARKVLKDKFHITEDSEYIVFFAD